MLKNGYARVCWGNKGSEVSRVPGRGIGEKPLTQLSGLSEHEMNNPLALCELAARFPNISAGHKVKQAWWPNDHVFILDFHCHALM